MLAETTQPSPATGGRCSVVLCDNQPAGVCPRTSQPLCRGHLKRQRRGVKSLGEATQLVLMTAPHRLAELKQHRQRLEEDRAELLEQFASLDDRLRYWRERVVGDAVGELDRLTVRVRALSDVSDFAEVANRSAEGGDWRHLFRLMDQIGDSVAFLTDCESPAREAESARVGACLAESQATCAALMADIDHLLAGPPAVLGPLAAGRVWRIALCDNTAGYWAGADGQVIRSRLAPSSGGSRLAPVCVVVAFHWDDAPDHLALLGMDGGGVVGRIRPPVRWNSQVYSLRCDPAEQLLFLSQGRAGVMVTDLAGRLCHLITPASLGLPARAKLTGLCLAPGRLHVLSYREQRVLTLRRDDWSIATSIDVDACYSPEFFTESLALLPRGRLLLTDWAGHAIRRIDAESGRIVDRLPAVSADKGDAGAAAATAASAAFFHSPYDALADKRGRLYVVDVTVHVVRLLDPDGQRCLRTFGGGEGDAEDARMSGPICLDLWEGDTRWDWLLVADSNNRRVRIFQVAKAD